MTDDIDAAAGRTANDIPMPSSVLRSAKPNEQERSDWLRRQFEGESDEEIARLHYRPLSTIEDALTITHDSAARSDMNPENQLKIARGTKIARKSDRPHKDLEEFGICGTSLCSVRRLASYLQRGHKPIQGLMVGGWSRETSQ